MARFTVIDCDRCGRELIRERTGKEPTGTTVVRFDGGDYCLLCYDVVMWSLRPSKISRPKSSEEKPVTR